MEARETAEGALLWQAKGDPEHPSNRSRVCKKGARVGETLDRNRLTVPLYRAQKTEALKPLSWERAMSLLADQVQSVTQTHGPDAFAMYGSGQLHTEDYYIAQKLVKGVLGTNNFDANSRLCMSSAVVAYKRAFGSDGPPCCYDDLDQADLIFIIGSNTAECHPVLFNRILSRRRKADGRPKLVVVDPRRTPTAAAADWHLAIRPGSDRQLLRGIARCLIERDAVDTAFVSQHTHGFDTFVDGLSGVSVEDCAEACGLTPNEIQAVAEQWSSQGRVLSLWSMGINQSSNGTGSACALINLHLITGQVGLAGAGPFSLTGQPNAMGGRESGGLVGLLPGYREVQRPEHREAIEAHWCLPHGSISGKRGLTAVHQVQALLDGRIRLWWVVATNPMVSMPSLRALATAGEACPFVVVNEAYATAETLSIANLVLPSAQWSEKTGVMTNSERRITLCPAFRPPPGEARADWQIFADLGARLGHPQAFSYASSTEVFAEAARATAGRPCDYSGLSHAVLAAHGPQQWPYPAGHQPTTEGRRLYTDREFSTPDGRAHFVVMPFHGLAEPTTADRPLVLTSGRVADQWHTMTRTGQSPRLLALEPEPRLDMHPKDAQRAAVEDGEWARVESDRGHVDARVRVTTDIQPGTVFLPIHWGASQPDSCEVNVLTHSALCPESHQPELKACAVSVGPRTG